jgi:RNA polymerase sigma factor (sigma-70 family)
VVEDIVSLTCVLILQDRLASRQSGTTTQQYAYKMVIKAASQVADRKHSRLVTRLKRRPRAQPMAEIPVEALERLQTQEEVWEAINELRDNLRIPLIMRFFDGMNSEEIGRDLGVTTNAIDLRLWQGKRKLRSRLKPPG